MNQSTDLKQIASQLAGVPVSEVIPASSGGNSRVYMVGTPNRLFALKQYPDIANDPRNRLETERHALELMHWHGTHSVPEWIACNPPFALMSWIDGTIITEPKHADIEDAAVFLGTIHHISRKTPHEDMPLASEACLSGQIIVDQLERRVAALMPYTKQNPQLMEFLTKIFMPAFAQRFMSAKRDFPNFLVELPKEKRTLIAADFGFHNIMRALDGRLYFIDFEYFGWDDPVKLMCDFLLHPATPLTSEMKHTFYQLMLDIYGRDIAERFGYYYPLFGLRWALILLNEFIPERWKTRAAARGLKPEDWERTKATQLVKAQHMIEQSRAF